MGDIYNAGYVEKVCPACGWTSRRTVSVFRSEQDHAREQVDFAQCPHCGIWLKIPTSKLILAVTLLIVAVICGLTIMYDVKGGIAIVFVAVITIPTLVLGIDRLRYARKNKKVLLRLLRETSNQMETELKAITHREEEFRQEDRAEKEALLGMESRLRAVYLGPTSGQLVDVPKRDTDRDKRAKTDHDEKAKEELWKKFRELSGRYDRMRDLYKSWFGELGSKDLPPITG